jgi:hypothetical protein
LYERVVSVKSARKLELERWKGFSVVKSWNRKAKLASADESAAPIHQICFLHFPPLFYPVSSFDKQVVA